MITVHHLNNSRSQRVLWLLEELALPYEIKFYERDPKTMLAPPELKKIHPLGKSPVITDGDLVIAESGAIIDYLIRCYGEGKLRPKAGTQEDLKYSYWLHYAEGTLMPPLLLSLIFSEIPKQPMPFFVKPIARQIADAVKKTFIFPQLKLNLDFVESELSKSDWFAGNEISGADIMMSFPLEAAGSRGGKEARPAIEKFLSKIHARPAYQEALRKGGVFSVPG
jgi:glutathione S-transferase